MSTRSTDSSRIEACAHLLRHLNDPAALRRNSLVAHFFPEPTERRAHSIAEQRAALARVRQLVRAAAEELRVRESSGPCATHAQRQHAILLRCDLKGDRHRAVAADLGLSLSQFYRERRAARIWVAEYLLQWREQAQPVAQSAEIFDSFPFEMARAVTLRDAGDYDAAVSSLQGLSARLERPSQRLQVYCSLVSFLTDARRHGEVHLALQAARECFANLQVSDAAALDEHRGRLEMATADYHWALGDPAAAIAANERAVAAFHSARFRPGTCAEELLASALLDLVHGYLSVGRFAEANASVAQARDIIADLPTPSPRLQAGLLAVLGLLQTNALDSIAQAIPTLQRALEIAQRHALGKEAMLALAGLSMHAQFRGDFARAATYTKECRWIAEHLLTPLDQSNLWLRTLELEAIAGRPHEALALASRVREHFAPESPGWTKALLFSSMASIASGDYVAAMHASQTAGEVASRKNDMRLHGSALRVHAAASARLGLRDAACHAIERAVAVLETHGSPYILLLSYEESWRITGNRRHALSAHDLRSSAFKPSRQALLEETPFSLHSASNTITAVP